MFGQGASMEPLQLLLRGDVAWAIACAGSLLGKNVEDLGTGRRCT